MGIMSAGMHLAICPGAVRALHCLLDGQSVEVCPDGQGVSGGLSLQPGHYIQRCHPVIRDSHRVQFLTDPGAGPHFLSG